MNPLTEAHFGDCVCGGKFESRMVEVRFNFTDRTLLFEDISQGKCNSCGSCVYQSGTLARMEMLYREGSKSRRPHGATSA